MDLMVDKKHIQLQYDVIEAEERVKGARLTLELYEKKHEVKFIIQHRYLPGWRRWHSSRIFDSKADAEKAIDLFLHKAGAGYTRKEKRVVPIVKT